MALIGTHVTLEPLQPEHATELWPAADDDAIRTLWPRRWQSVEDVGDQFRMLMEWQSQGNAEPYLIRTNEGKAAGSTVLYSIDAMHRSATIGWTFVVTPFRRTAVNTEAKLLMLTHAFEDLGLERVQFDVDARNKNSQKAVERIGATREGVLRRHKVLWDGFVRDTVVFSITRDEWPRVKAGLEERLR